MAQVDPVTGFASTFLHYQVGMGTSFSLWHDPWHEGGPLCFSFPWDQGTPPSLLRHPCARLFGRALGTGLLSQTWRVLRLLIPFPPFMGAATVFYGLAGGSSSAAYAVFSPPGPKVGWSSLLVGTFKIPRHQFILWLAILGRLSTLDKPWLHQLGTACVLCQDALPESHEHLFFTCSFATECLHTIRREVFFHWPYNHWPAVIQWASVRWRGSMWSMLRSGRYWLRLFIICGKNGTAASSST
ncbi:UNVERIFIED_CONTAM: hypothetical protein Slati_2453600 [Sesamum latifolium]|uniref:Reverse transcriptase zinc-binding domain-containing protein n=1 Tax=Sesamum latifolium TaxID=2727402 RepID=A0AAW2WIB5_9LAMI